jgi:hypothetical protein
MKFCLFVFLLLMAAVAQAEPVCDLRVGESIGIQVLEFSSGSTVHSKMAMVETSPKAIVDEMINLQDMGICAEKIVTKKCTLRFEKKKKGSLITMYRGKDRWVSWSLSGKKEAQSFVRSLKKVGFCS